MWIDLTLDDLKEASWNYKKDASFMMDKLINNIKINGFLENLIVREVEGGYEVVNGNHRLNALISIGWDKHIKCFNLGKISLAKAKRIALETNETRFKTDPLKLSSLLDDIQLEYDSMELLDTLPLTTEELVDLSTVDLDLNIENEKPVNMTIKLYFDNLDNMNEFKSYLSNVDPKHYSLELLYILRSYHGGKRS